MVTTLLVPLFKRSPPWLPAVLVTMVPAPVTVTRLPLPVPPTMIGTVVGTIVNRAPLATVSELLSPPVVPTWIELPLLTVTVVPAPVATKLLLVPAFNWMDVRPLKAPVGPMTTCPPLVATIVLLIPLEKRSEEPDKRPPSTISELLLEDAVAPMTMPLVVAMPLRSSPPVLTVTLPIGVEPLVGPIQMLKFEMDVVMFVVPVKTEF